MGAMALLGTIAFVAVADTKRKLAEQAAQNERNQSAILQLLDELADLAGSIVREVADRAPRKVLVAGSLPPLDESFRPDLVPPDDEARAVYANLATTLLPYVDVYLCETMSSIRESVNALTAVRETVAILKQADTAPLEEEP